MSASKVLPYEDSASAREELIPFLTGAFPGGPDAARWRLRLAHWWDENPFCEPGSPRGWVLRHEGRLAGFLGLIPARYAAQGAPVSALLGTSWYIVEGHRNAALPMAMQYQRQAGAHLLVETTPSPEVRAMLERAGWTGETRARRLLLPCGAVGSALVALRGKAWPSLQPGRRVVTDTAEVLAVARAWQRPDRLEKWVCPASLRWYAASTMRRHLFAGVVDGAGCLSSFAWLTPHHSGQARLAVLEGFTTEADDTEWRALMGAVARGEAAWPGARAWALTWLAFDTDELAAGAPFLRAGWVDVCHYHKKPPALAAPKHSVMAEGDFGL
ncbi:MAG TPA: hypothetical protein PLP58_01970 [Prosthecobacter sp.]|nr:hypothetical protein [Prosthecobacter sp.]